MSWISDRLFGRRQSQTEELASNLYDALVLGGGPSAEAESHVDADDLEIPIYRLERFAEKRLIMLEAFLFVATNIATAAAKPEPEKAFVPVHPLALQVGKHLSSKWALRGITNADPYTVGLRCFDEVSVALSQPFKWGRTWLDEFYDDPAKSGEHYIRWTEQCLKELQTMQKLVGQYV